MILTKIVIMSFHEKNTKITIYFLHGKHYLNFQIPTAWGLTKSAHQACSSLELQDIANAG